MDCGDHVGESASEIFHANYELNYTAAHLTRPYYDYETSSSIKGDDFIDRLNEYSY